MVLVISIRSLSEVGMLIVSYCYQVVNGDPLWSDWMFNFLKSKNEVD